MLRFGWLINGRNLQKFAELKKEWVRGIPQRQENSAIRKMKKIKKGKSKETFVEKI